METTNCCIIYRDDGTQPEFLIQEDSDLRTYEAPEGFQKLELSRDEAFNLMLGIRPECPGDDTSIWGLRRDSLIFERLSSSPMSPEMSALFQEEYRFTVTTDQARGWLKQIIPPHGECYLLRIGTGCTCCNDDDYYIGPFLNKATAEREMARCKESPTRRSQYAPQGQYYIAKTTYEILPGREGKQWMILDERFAYLCNTDVALFAETNPYSWHNELSDIPNKVFF